MGDGKGCNKWLTYALGVLALVFLILTIVFGVKMNDEETKHVTVEKEVPVEVAIGHASHPLRGDGESSLMHDFYDPIQELGGGAKKLYADSEYPLSAEVEAIYSKLTHEQKIGQLVQYAFGDAVGPPIDNVVDPSEWAELARQGKVSSILNVPSLAMANELQRAAKEFGIPLIMGLDVIHGHRCIAPNPLGMSSSWDPEMVYRLAKLWAKEARAEGQRWSFGPMLDVGRDARRGGTMDGWGEDAFMPALYAPQIIKGFQEERVAACVKHVAAYGIGTGGRDYTGNEIFWPTLHNEYFGGYKAAIEAGAWSTMVNLAELMGVPGHASREINTDVQRGLWGFRGPTLSDYGGTGTLWNQGYADENNRTEMALMSFLSGIDLDMADGLYQELWNVDPNWTYLNHTFAEYVDLSARRIVWLKEQVGLFEDYGILDYDTNENLWDTVLMTPEILQESQEAAEKSMVLLKNEGDVLPLDPTDANNKILIVGRIADDYKAHLGYWHAVGSLGSRVVTYLTNFLTATDEICGTSLSSGPYDPQKTQNWCLGDPLGGETSKKEAPASRRLQEEEETPKCNIEYLPGVACLLNIDLTKDEPLMKEVEDAIAANDYTHIIYVAGETDFQNGESAVRAHLELPHAQSILSQRIVEAAAKKATKPKLVLVPIIGRPNLLTYEQENYDAILLAWTPGTRGGPAIWNMLRGTNRSPGGALPVTFPRAMGQIPIYHASPNCGRPLPEDRDYPPYLGEDTEHRYKSRYIDESIKPLYPFGHGLSYNTFTVDSVNIGPETISIADDTPIKIDISLTREGAYAGKAAKVMQVYVRQWKGTPVPPDRRIIGFKRFEFDAADKTLTATVELKPSEVLARYDLQLDYHVQPGIYGIFVGENAYDERFFKNITIA